MSDPATTMPEKEAINTGVKKVEEVTKRENVEKQERKKHFRLSMKLPFLATIKKRNCEKTQIEENETENNAKTTEGGKKPIQQVKCAFNGGVSKLRSSLRGLKTHCRDYENEDVVQMDDGCSILEYWKELLENNLVATSLIHKGVFCNKEDGKLRSYHPETWTPTVAQNKKLRTLFSREVNPEGKTIKYSDKNIKITKRTQDNILIGEFVDKVGADEEFKFVAITTEQMIFTALVEPKNFDDSVKTLKDFTDQLVAQQF